MDFPLPGRDLSRRIRIVLAFSGSFHVELQKQYPEGAGSRNVIRGTKD
jgi:hypothetical protein